MTVDLHDRFTEALPPGGEKAEYSQSLSDELEVLDCLSFLVVVVDEEGYIRNWNSVAENMFGVNRSEVLGKTVRDKAVPWDGRTVGIAIRECQQKGECVALPDMPFSRIDGSEGVLGITATPARRKAGRAEVVVAGADITEKRSIQARLEQATKLEAMGQLAAGIAHEIKTPTQFVADNIRFLQEEVHGLVEHLQGARAAAEHLSRCDQAEPEAREWASAYLDADIAYLCEELPAAAGQCGEGVKRIQDIVKAMKEFSHPGSRTKSPVDINHAVETTVALARNEWKYVADVQLDLQKDLPAVLGFAGDLEQVLLNLLVNAVHAVEDVVGRESGNQGLIKIATREVGNWVEITVADSGVGIPEQVQSKVFELFFTTKQAGRGTGQGLALARTTIVEKHGGKIDFETESGKGTTFRILLPIPLEGAENELGGV